MIESNARHSEIEELEILERYAAYDEEEKVARSKKEEIRGDVVRVLDQEYELAESGSDERLRVGNHTFERSYTRKYNNKRLDIEREIEVNGQLIVASVNQLNKARKRLDQFFKTDEWVEGHSTRITVKRI